MSISIEEIIQIVRLQMGVKSVAASQLLVEDLNAESIDLVNIVLKVEEKYKITFPERDIAEIRTVEDIYRIALRIAGQ